MPVDDRYFDGVWYDLETGDFCKFVRTGDGVGLVAPDNQHGEPYYLFDEEYDEDEDIQSAINADFRQVSDEAVDNPVEVVKRAVRMQSRNDINELASVPFQEAIDLRYARTQVEIVES